MQSKFCSGKKIKFITKLLVWHTSENINKKLQQHTGPWGTVFKVKSIIPSQPSTVIGTVSKLFQIHQLYYIDEMKDLKNSLRNEL